MTDPRQFSDWVSAEARAFVAELANEPPAPADLEGARRHYGAFNQRLLDTALSIYGVAIEEGEIAGVRVQIVTPSGGVTDARTLICLHGGAFMWGSGAGALVEAVPAAALSGMRVVAVNYRLAPEHLYPAAVDDVIAVYRALLNEQPAATMGIYGASAGAILTGQAAARISSEGLPMPGALAMLHGAPIDFTGDAALFADTFNLGSEPLVVPNADSLPYFMTADLDDPLVLPGRDPATLKAFPPSLLMTGTRDFAAGATAMMHRRLLAAGVDARFVLFDGMYHGGHVAAQVPEARETHDILVAFFRQHLA